MIFNRALGPVRPREVDSELFDITYVGACVCIAVLCKRQRQKTSTNVQVQCGDPSVEKKIEDKISLLYGWVEKHPGKRGQVLAAYATVIFNSFHVQFLNTCSGEQVCLSFYDKRKKQSWLGLGGHQEERLFWEQW